MPTVTAAAVALLFSPACRAELKVEPSAQFQQTYTDNVSLAPPDQARSLWISELTPGLTVRDDSPRLQLLAAYEAARGAPAVVAEVPTASEWALLLLAATSVALRAVRTG